MFSTLVVPVLSRKIAASSETEVEGGNNDGARMTNDQTMTNPKNARTSSARSSRAKARDLTIGLVIQVRNAYATWSKVPRLCVAPLGMTEPVTSLTPKAFGV